MKGKNYIKHLKHKVSETKCNIITPQGTIIITKMTNDGQKCDVIVAYS